VCGSLDHWAKKCPNHKGRKPQSKQKTVNMVVSSSGGGTSGYGNSPYVLLVFQPTTWWLDSGANVHVCSDASLFSSYQVTRDSSVMIGNGSHVSVRGVDTVVLESIKFCNKSVNNTYSPIARLTTIRVLLSLATSHGLLVHQMDVKRDFLNGELE
jgi:hypothetical protein